MDNQFDLLEFVLAPFGILLNVLISIILAPVRLFFPEA